MSSEIQFGTIIKLEVHIGAYSNHEHTGARKVSGVIRRIGLYCDSLLNRDKYLSSLSSRILHFKDLDTAPSIRVIDEPIEADPENLFRVPETDAADFNIEFLKKSIRENGCVIVRNFFGTGEVNAMKAYIDYAFSVNNNREGIINKYVAKPLDLEPVLQRTRDIIREKKKVNPTYSNTAMFGSKLMQPLGQNRSFLTAQTPVVAEKLLALFARKKLKTLLRKYFGNDPCVSVHKWVLRKSDPPATPIDFHQDGAFMGDEISSLNCWIPLSDCGAGHDIHGLDIVPIRFMNAFKKGSGLLDWTISADAIVDEYTRDAIVTPTFRKGDLLFFDHLLVHRSQSLANYSQRRYAVETWFFDSVNFPKNQIPIKW